VMDALALIVSASGVLVLMLATSTWRSALPIAIELWTGAGLLRLTGSPDWTRVATAAAIIVVRHVVMTRLRPYWFATGGDHEVERE
jgi:hypothetical protein